MRTETRAHLLDILMEIDEELEQTDPRDISRIQLLKDREECLTKLYLGYRHD